MIFSIKSNHYWFRSAVWEGKPLKFKCNVAFCIMKWAIFDITISESSEKNSVVLHTLLPCSSAIFLEQIEKLWCSGTAKIQFQAKVALKDNGMRCCVLI